MPRSRRTLGHRFRRSLADPVRQLQLSLLILLLLVVFGMLGYVLLEGASPLDALYMTVITIATVGFREAFPLSSAGQLFTILLIVLGVGAGAWAISRGVEVMLGQALWSTMERRRMNDYIAALRGHYIVCGYGRLGSRIVRDLEARGEPFVVVDASEQIAARLLEEEIPHVTADATHDETLLQAGIMRARGLVSALDNDASNVLTVLTARGLNPRLLIVARSNAETSEGKMLRAGADRVVTPESIGGHRLAIALLRPGVHDFLNRMFSFHPDLEIDVGQVTIPAGSPLAGQTVAACDLRRVRNLSILAIQPPAGDFVFNPSVEHVIQPGETLILIGPAEAIYDMEALYSG